MSSIQPSHDDHDTPRIYVACLAAYNAGTLHGRWIDATQGAEAIDDEIRAMLAESPEPGAEEFAIHDYENFCGIELHEYESIATVAALAEQIAEHGKLFAEVYTHEGNVETAIRMLEEQYDGAYSSLADWAERFMEDTGQLQSLPANLRSYFDYEAFARDAELGGDIETFEVEGQVHVFWSR